MGSTNGTQAARRRIEFGVWSSDPDLLRHNYEYLLSLLTFSEPGGATTIGPEPELVSTVWDDDAHGKVRVDEIAREYGLTAREVLDRLHEVASS